MKEQTNRFGEICIQVNTEAIKKEKPLDLGIMTGDAEAVRKVG